MNNTNTGGPAFPVPGLSNLPNGNFIHPECGMTLREYAAIKLKIPSSGIDWLDDMIRKSLLDDFAAKAMATFMVDVRWGANTYEEAAKASYNLANAMLKESKT